MSRTHRFRYLIIIMAVALAFLVRLWLAPKVSVVVPSLTFWPVVLLGALYGGLGIGVYACLLSTLVVACFLLLTRFAVDLKDPQEGFIVLVFLMVSTLASYRIGSLRMAQRMVEQGAKTLQIILDKLGNAVILTDMNGVAISWNAGASQVDGDTEAERVGKPPLRTPLTLVMAVVTAQRDRDDLSDDIGLGSCATPSLSPSPAPRLQADPIGQRPISVLLVEDNEDTLRSLAYLLRSCGYTVTTADNVSLAMTFTREPFDILLSDIELPDGTGLDLMREFRGRVPGIAMSGFGSSEDIQTSIEAGFSLHLTKPITLRQLTDAMHKVLSN